MNKKWKKFRYKIEAIEFIRSKNLSMDCLKGTNGKWYVEWIE